MLLLKYKKITALFAAFALTYVLQTLLIVPNKESLTKYHLTVASARILSLSFILPYIVIWTFGLIGYLRLKEYAHGIKESKDGDAFETICIGILLIVLWMPVTSVISSFSTLIYTHDPSSTANLIRLNNYVSILIFIPAFWYLYQGSNKLIKLIKKPSHGFYQWTTIGYLAFAAMYTYLTLQDTVRNHPTTTVTTSTYYQPDWLIILTVVIPRLIMWFLGLMAVQNILLYRQRVKGSLYQQALKSLASGIAWVVLSSILLRSIQSLSSWLSNWSLSFVILLIYILLVAIGVGYVLIARGASKLQKIEEL